MPADLFDRFTALAVAPFATTDPAFAARPRLLKLRDALTRAAKRLRPARWNEPPVFFFDPRRQTELEAFRPPTPDRFAELTAFIHAEMPTLLATIEVRRVARAIDGLAVAAKALASQCPAALDLADLLAVPDDEVFLAITPATRTGVRLHLRGAADVAQLRQMISKPNPPSPFPEGRENSLFPSPLAGEGGGASLPDCRPADRSASRLAGEGLANPVAEVSPLTRSCPAGGDPCSLPSPARGEGETRASSLQLFTPAALQSDGTLPPGFAGCDHWLWPTQPLAAVPRIGGERVVLVAPAVVKAADAEPRFPTLVVEARVIQTLNPFQITEFLSRLCGHSVPVHPSVEATPVARAA